MYDDEDNFDKAFQDHDIIDDESFGSKRKKMPVMFVDKHHHTVKRSLINLNPGKDKHKRKKTLVKTYDLSFYSSGDTGSNIRDAVTGEYTKYIVGSTNQELFFKVIIATGESPNGPMTLFYASPEEYEQHQNCQVDQYVRDKWYNKFSKMRRE
jgi:hypothetical protein